MARGFHHSTWLSCKVFLMGIFLLAGTTYAASTITGTIYDLKRNPLPEVNVELLNDYYQVINRAVTEGTGRYEFSNLPDGRYTVKVLPLKYDLMEQTQLVEIYTSTVRGQGGGISLEIRDFYLQPRKDSMEEAEASVVFVQEVPQEARKVYEDAVELFSKKKRTDAMVGLRKALKIFPDYFQALNRLGRELVIEGKYGEAFPLLMRASDINPKSPTAYYYLGYSLYKLEYYPAALVALTQAQVLSPKSHMVLWTLGAVERHEKKLADAEKHLTAAKKLLKTSLPDLNFELALLYRDLGEFQKAADELEIFLKARPDAKDAQQIKKLIAEYRAKGNR